MMVHNQTSCDFYGCVGAIWNLIQHCCSVFKDFFDPLLHATTHEVHSHHIAAAWSAPKTPEPLDKLLCSSDGKHSAIFSVDFSIAVHQFAEFFMDECDVFLKGTHHEVHCHHIAASWSAPETPKPLDQL